MGVTRRALLSVYDKTGIVEFADALHANGWELLSSGGTARVIGEAGVPVTDVADHTGSPIMLGHRVVTLHPKIHGGILADRDDADHRADLERHDIEPIDLVVVNLYPFAREPGIEMIDIGGPTMVRAAAKNHAHVAVVVDPSEYEAVIGELKSPGGISGASRRRLARAAFAHTAAYDAAIVSWMDAVDPEAAELPETIHLALERAETLRYGENPHQHGARYRVMGSTEWWDSTIQHAGLAPSYLNIFDGSAAWALAHELGEGPAVAIIKHANPCGAAAASTLHHAYELAYGCDPRSAFGGIVAANRPIDLATVAHMESAAQADVIIAPGYEDGVIDRLVAKRKNTRILEAAAPVAESVVVRRVSGAWLGQTAPSFRAAPEQWRVVTKRSPTDAEMADAEFAWHVCGHVSSNAIVLAKDRTAFGIGAGQQNRVEAGELAAAKADGRAQGGASASDAFYPFPDGIEAAHAAGVAVVVQPGGSVNDETVIARADELGLAMLFTGERQFKH